LLVGTDPDVLVVTFSVPVVGGVGQLTVNGAVAVPPAGTFTLWGLALVTVQFAGNPDRATL